MKINQLFIEETPNPDALKFVFSSVLLENGFIEWNENKHEDNLEWVKSLFELNILRIYVYQNFITLLKQPDKNWEEIKPLIQNIFSSEFYLNLKPNNNDNLYLNETEVMIQNWLESQILPATSRDGGRIQIKSFYEGKLTISLTGACYACPYVPMTVMKGIEPQLKLILPELKIIEVDVK